MENEEKKVNRCESSSLEEEKKKKKKRQKRNHRKGRKKREREETTMDDIVPKKATKMKKDSGSDRNGEREAGASKDDQTFGGTTNEGSVAADGAGGKKMKSSDFVDVEGSEVEHTYATASSSSSSSSSSNASKKVEVNQTSKTALLKEAASKPTGKAMVTKDGSLPKAKKSEDSDSPSTYASIVTSTVDKAVDVSTRGKGVKPNAAVAAGAKKPPLSSKDSRSDTKSDQKVQKTITMSSDSETEEMETEIIDSSDAIPPNRARVIFSCFVHPDWGYNPDIHNFVLYSPDLDDKHFFMTVSDPSYFDDKSRCFRSANVIIDIPLNILIRYSYQRMPKKQKGKKPDFSSEEVRSGKDLFRLSREKYHYRVLKVNHSGLVCRYDPTTVPSSSFSSIPVANRFMETTIIQSLHNDAYKWRICDEVLRFRMKNAHAVSDVKALLDTLGLIHQNFVLPVQLMSRKGRSSIVEQEVSLTKEYVCSILEDIIEDDGVKSDETFSAVFALAMTAILGKFELNDMKDETYEQLMKSLNSSYATVADIITMGLPSIGDDYCTISTKGLTILLNKANGDIWRHWFRTLVLLHDSQGSDIFLQRSTPKQWCGLKDIQSRRAWSGIAKLSTQDWVKLNDVARDSVFIRRMALLFSKTNDLVQRASALGISCIEIIDCLGMKLSAFNKGYKEGPNPYRFDYHVYEDNPNISTVTQNLIVYTTANKPGENNFSHMFAACNIFLDGYVLFHEKRGPQTASYIEKSICDFLRFVLCINQIDAPPSFQEGLSNQLIKLCSLFSGGSCLNASFWHEMMLLSNDNWYHGMLKSNFKHICRRISSTLLIKAYFTTDWKSIKKGSWIEDQFSIEVAEIISEMARRDPQKLHDLMDQHIDVTSPDPSGLSLPGTTMKDAISLLVGHFIPEQDPTLCVLQGMLSESILRIFLQLLATKSLNPPNEEIMVGLIKDLDSLLDRLVSSDIQIKVVKTLSSHSQKFARLLAIVREANVVQLCDLSRDKISSLNNDEIPMILDEIDQQILSYERRCHKIRIMWEFGYSGSPAIPDEIFAAIRDLRMINEEKMSTIALREEALCSFLHECLVHFDEFRASFVKGKFSIRDVVYDLPENIEQTSFFKEVVMKASNTKNLEMRLKQISDCKALVLHLGEALFVLDNLLRSLLNTDDRVVKIAKSVIEDVDEVNLSLSEFATDEMLILIGILKQMNQAESVGKQSAEQTLLTAASLFGSISDAKELFKWWKKEMPSAKEFQMFLKLAHSSAGESDFEVDRIHTLDHIGDALAGFLYGELVKDPRQDNSNSTIESELEVRQREKYTVKKVGGLQGNEKCDKACYGDDCRDVEELGTDSGSEMGIQSVQQLDFRKLHDAVKLALNHFKEKPNLIDMIKDVYKHRAWLINIHASHRCDRTSSVSKVRDIFSRGTFYLSCDADMKATLASEGERPTVGYSLMNLRDLNDKLIFFSKDRRTKEILDFMKIFEILFELMLKLHALKKLEVPLFSGLEMSVCCARGREDICLYFRMWEHGMKFSKLVRHDHGDAAEEADNEDIQDPLSVPSPNEQLETLRTISSDLSSIVIRGWEKHMNDTREEFPILNQFTALQLSRLAKLTALYCVPEYMSDDVEANHTSDGLSTKAGRKDVSQRMDVIEIVDSDEEVGIIEGKNNASSSKSKLDKHTLVTNIHKSVGVELQWLLHEVNQDLTNTYDDEWNNIKAAVELSMDLMVVDDQQSFVDCATEWSAQRESDHWYILSEFHTDSSSTDTGISRGRETIKSLGWNADAICQEFGVQSLEDECLSDHLVLLLIQKSNDSKSPFHLEHDFDFVGGFIEKLWGTILKAWKQYPVLFIGGIQCDTLDFGGGTNFSELGRFLQVIQDKSPRRKHHGRSRLNKTRGAFGRNKAFFDENFFQYHTHHCIEDEFRSGSIKTPHNVNPRYGTPLVTLIPTDLKYEHVIAISKHTNRFPQQQEVLICASDTSIEDVKLFFRRAFSHKKGNQSIAAPRSFFLLDVENLDFNVAENALSVFDAEMKRANLTNLSFQEKNTPSFGMSKKTNRPRSEENIGQYAAAIYIMCSNSSLRTSHFASAFIQYQISAPPLQRSEHTEYLYQQWTNSTPYHMIVSDSFGNGKTWFVKEALQDEKFCHYKYVKHTFSNEEIDEQTLCQKLIKSTMKCINNSIDLSDTIAIFPHRPLAIHLVFSPAVKYRNLDAFLFKLTVLKTLEVGNGEIWRLDPTSVVFVEVEVSWITQNSFARHLNQIHVHSPRELLKQLDSHLVDTNLSENGSFDEIPSHQFQIRGLRSPHFLRVAKHLSGVRHVKVKDDECHEIFALRITIEQCGVKNPSWAQLSLFVRFLDHQLQACDNSVYLHIGSIAPDSGLSGYKEFVVKLMIQMSRDFAIHSVKISDESNSIFGEVRMNNDARQEDEVLNRSIMLQFRRPWETSPHPYLFFNEDAQTFTFLGFTVTSAGDLLDHKNQILEKNVMKPELFQGLQMQGVNFSEKFELLPKSEKLHRLYRVFGLHIEGVAWDPAPEFELTTDNCQKILAMHLRFRCMIPVAMFGETGIGKTALLSYYSKLLVGRPDSSVTNLKIVHVDGGVTAENVKDYIQCTSCLARENWLKGIHSTILFFDECNTSRDALWLAQEIMCDQTCDGENIDALDKYGLKIAIACNPYRMHPPELIARLEKAGLGYHAGPRVTEQGQVRLRDLVYRVHPLPPSLQVHIFDFGSLSVSIEKKYTSLIIRHMVVEVMEITGEYKDLEDYFTDLICSSQDFMRSCKNEKSFVSLRDVKRFRDVFLFFADHVWNKQLGRILQTKENMGLSDKTLQQTPIVCALGICYYLSLSPGNRDNFLETICNRSSGCLLGSPNGFEQLLRLAMSIFVQELRPLLRGKSIAENAAFSENVFLFIICSELRIPLFLIGKPGTSKSLAKSIVGEAMQGPVSESKLFRDFSQCIHVSYQCSPLSTPEGIKSVFREASQYQKGKDITRYVAMVVLDEVGLAEDSNTMALKSLHALLENGCSPDGEVEAGAENSSNKVSFCGMSNWALDPAKMNRGVLVSREEPNREELLFTAECILQNHEQNIICKRRLGFVVDCYLKLLALQRELNLKEGAPELYGLRDFYSFLKLVVSTVEASPMRTDQSINTAILYSIMRNFRSKNLSRIDPSDIFMEALLPQDFVSDLLPRINFLDLLRDNIVHEDPDGSNPVRYPLVVTREPNIVLSMLEQYQGLTDELEIIHGAPFKDDHSYTSICRCIDRVKLCLESGKKVALINCGYIYESIYDAMNQYYQTWGGGKYVNLGLGTHRPPCRVHSKSRLIIFASLEEVEKEFPIPLINRLEKHEISSSMALQDDGRIIAEDLMKFCQHFVRRQTLIRHQDLKFGTSNCFVGFNEDTCFSIASKTASTDERESRLKEAIMFLLETASPDSVIRFHKNTKESLDFTFRDSILDPTLRVFMDDSSEKILQVTTFSRLLTKMDIPYLENELFGKKVKNFNSVHTDSSNMADFSSHGKISSFTSSKIELIMLNSIQSESQLIDTLESKIIHRQSKGLVILQCGETFSTGADRSVSKNLIECTRFHIQNILNRCAMQTKVLLIIQLPLRLASDGFVIGQAAFCRCIHIDELMDNTDNIIPKTSEILQCSGPVSKFLESFFLGKEDKLRRRLLRSIIWQACSAIQDVDQNISRHSSRVLLLMKIIEGGVDGEGVCSSEFLEELVKAASMQQAIIEEKKSALGFTQKCWISRVAETFNMSGTFRNAILREFLSQVSLSLAKVISDWDRFDNLSLVVRFPTLWLPMAKGLQCCGSFKVDAVSETEDMSRTAAKESINETFIKPLAYHGRDLHFQSNFPFFPHLYELLSGLWDKFKTYEDFLKSCQQMELNHTIAKICHQRSNTHENNKSGGHKMKEIGKLTLSYCMDLIQLLLDSERIHIKPKSSQVEFIRIVAQILQQSSNIDSGKDIRIRDESNLEVSFECDVDEIDEEDIAVLNSAKTGSIGTDESSFGPLAQVYSAHGFYMMNMHNCQHIFRLFEVEPGVVLKMLTEVDLESSVTPDFSLGCDLHVLLNDILDSVILSLNSEVQEFADGQSNLKALWRWSEKVKKVKIPVKAIGLETDNASASWEKVILVDAFVRSVIKCRRQIVVEAAISPLLSKLICISGIRTFEGFIALESFIVQAHKEDIPVQLLKKFWLDALVGVIFVQDSTKFDSGILACAKDKDTITVDERISNRLIGYLLNRGNDDTAVLRRVIGLQESNEDSSEQSKFNAPKDVVLHVLIIHLLLTADKNGICFRHLFSRDDSISLPKILFAFVCEDIEYRNHVEMSMLNSATKLLSTGRHLEDGCEPIRYDEASDCALDMLQKGLEAVQVLTHETKFDLVKRLQNLGRLRFVIGIFVGFLGLEDDKLLSNVVDDIEGGWKRLFLIVDDNTCVLSDSVEIMKKTQRIKDKDNDNVASTHEDLRVSMLTFSVCDLYQRHGLGILQKNLKRYPWLLPSEFQSQEVDTAFSDNFKLYGTSYQDAMNSVSFFLAGLCGEDEIEVKSNSREFPSIVNLDEEIMVVIAVLNTFIVISTTVNRNHVNRVVEKLAQGKLLSHLFGNEANTITADLFHNKIVSLRQQLHAAFVQDDTFVVVAQILIHIWVVLAKSKVVAGLDIMVPFQDLGSNIDQLYLPGMESDVSAEVQGATGDVTRWYSCQCGEQYGVGNCGQLNGSGRCAKCGQNIGQGGVANNARSEGDKRGHILARHDARNIREESSERYLSPQDRATLFAILHASLSINASDDIVLAEMLQHLYLDLTSLSRHGSVSIEDASLLVHVLMKMLIVGGDAGNNCSQVSNDKYSQWRTPVARRVWEETVKKSMLDCVYLDSASSLNRVRNDILEVGDETTSKFRVLLQNSSNVVKNFEESDFSVGRQVVTRQTLVSDPLMWQTRERITISNLKNVVSKFTPEEQRHFPSITTILVGQVNQQSNLNNGGTSTTPEAFSFIKSLPEIVSLRDQVLGTLSYVAHEITTELVKQRFPLLFKKLEKIAKTLGIWKKSDVNPSPKKLFEENGIADQVIKLLVNKQNSVASASSALQISADMPRSTLISLDVFHDILPLAIQNSSYSFIDNKLKVDFDFKNLEIVIQEMFLQGRPTLIYITKSNDSRRIHSTSLNNGLVMATSFINVSNSLDKAETEKVTRVKNLIIESHERLPDYTESRDTLAMIMKFVEVRINSSSTKTDTNQALIEFINTSLRYKLPSCLENVLHKEQTITLSDCFWLFEMIKIRLTLFLRRGHVHTFTTQEGFDLPLKHPIQNFNDSNDDSNQLLYWCAAVHDLLTFWASTQHCYTEDHATLDELSLRMRHPRPEEPIFVYLAHFGFGDFPDENVTVGQGVAIFESLARRASLCTDIATY